MLLLKGSLAVAALQMSPVGTSGNLTLGFSGAAGRAARSEQAALGQREGKINGEINNHSPVQIEPGGTGGNALVTNCYLLWEGGDDVLFVQQLTIWPWVSSKAGVQPVGAQPSFAVPVTSPLGSLQRFDVSSSSCARCFWFLDLLL